MTHQGSWGFLTKLICSLSIAMVLMPAAAFSAPQSTMSPGNASASSPASAQPANGTPSLRYPPANGCPAYSSYISGCESGFTYCILGVKKYPVIKGDDARILDRIERLKKEQYDLFIHAPKLSRELAQEALNKAVEIGELIKDLLAEVLSWTKDPATIQKCSQEFEKCCRKAADMDSSITWPKS